MCYKNRFYLLIISLLIFCCKSSKLSIKTAKGALLPEAIIEAYEKKHTNELEGTLSFNGKISLLKGKNLYKANFKLKNIPKEMIRGKAFFMGISIGEGSMDLKGIRFYEKVFKSYLDRDFSFFKHYLALDLSYTHFESLLYGKPLVNLLEDHFNLSFTKEPVGYVFTSKNNTSSKSKADNLFLSNNHQYEVVLDEHFFIRSQLITYLKGGEKKSLKIQYEEWVEVEGNFFPKAISIFINNNQEASFSIYHNTISKQKKDNREDSFSIPKGYTEIKL